MLAAVAILARMLQVRASGRLSRVSRSRLARQKRAFRQKRRYAKKPVTPGGSRGSIGANASVSVKAVISEGMLPCVLPGKTIITMTLITITPKASDICVIGFQYSFRWRPALMARLDLVA